MKILIVCIFQMQILEGSFPFQSMEASQYYKKSVYIECVKRKSSNPVWTAVLFIQYGQSMTRQI